MSLGSTRVPLRFQHISTGVWMFYDPTSKDLCTGQAEKL